MNQDWQREQRQQDYQSHQDRMQDDREGRAGQGRSQRGEERYGQQAGYGAQGEFTQRGGGYGREVYGQGGYGQQQGGGNPGRGGYGMRGGYGHDERGASGGGPRQGYGQREQYGSYGGSGMGQQSYEQRGQGDGGGQSGRTYASGQYDGGRSGGEAFGSGVGGFGGGGYGGQYRGDYDADRGESGVGIGGAIRRMFSGEDRDYRQPQRGRHYGRGPKGYARSDERICEEVNDRLMYDDNVDPSEIEVSVEGGVVTLSGTVEDRNEKFQMEQIAESILGVKDVVNQIRVQRPGHDATQKQTGQETSERSTRRSGANR